jgi:hypothetical protein
MIKSQEAKHKMACLVLHKQTFENRLKVATTINFSFENKQKEASS